MRIGIFFVSLVISFYDAVQYFSAVPRKRSFMRSLQICDNQILPDLLVFHFFFVLLVFFLPGRFMHSHTIYTAIIRPILTNWSPVDRWRTESKNKYAAYGIQRSTYLGNTVVLRTSSLKLWKLFYSLIPSTIV